MRLTPQDLKEITDLTLSHYNERAEDFWEGTRDHNVGQNIAALLQCIEGEPPFAILDFGCGPGRDLKGAHKGPQFGDLAPLAAFDGASARALDHTVLEREFHGHGRIIGAAFAPSFR